MAVIGSKLIDCGGGLDSKGQFTHWAKFRVFCNARDDTDMEVLFGAALALPDPIPSWKASYVLLGSSDPNAFAQEFTAVRESVKDNACIWLVTVNWSPSESDPDDDWTNDQDPLLKPIIIDGYEEEIQEVCDVGWNDEELPGIGRDADTFGAIVTAAGKQPGTPFTKRRRLPGLIFEKPFKDLPGNDALTQIMTLANSHTDTLCNATFYGGGAGKVICRSIEPSKLLFAGNKKYRIATIRVLYNERGHSFPMVNCGFDHLKAKDGGGFELVQATRKPDTPGGQPRLVTEPVNLKLDGTLAGDDEMGTIINWRTSPKTDFTLLGVGTG
ncbi:hypothetical protein [Lacipirellula sp.]|uniref:hypothetical protein n=1 Tax=Lacipirellula sp. TaxID=2691419 RepID=UPI003D0CEA71